MNVTNPPFNLRIPSANIFDRTPSGPKCPRYLGVANDRLVYPRGVRFRLHQLDHLAGILNRLFRLSQRRPGPLRFAPYQRGFSDVPAGIE